MLSLGRTAGFLLLSAALFSALMPASSASPLPWNADAQGSVWAGDRASTHHPQSKSSQTKTFAFLVNREPSSLVSEFRVDDQIVPLSPATVTTGFAPISEEADPLGNYLYVGNAGGAISQYHIGATGVLAPLSPSTVATEVGPFSIKMTPNGHYLYAVGVAGTLSQYRISTNGTLKPLSPATVDIGFAGRSIAIDPSGRYAYVLTQNQGEPIGYGGTLAQYRIGADGALQAFTPSLVLRGSGRAYTITRPAQIAFGPGGQFAYVASSDGLATLKANHDGTLTPVQVPPLINLADDPGVSAVSVFAFHPSAHVIYTVNGYSNSGANVLSLLKILPDGTPSLTTRYSIQNDGTLVPLTLSDNVTPPASDANVTSFALDPAGRHLYAVNFAGQGCLFQYQIKPDGMLQSLVATVIAVSRAPYRILIASRPVLPQ